VAASHRPLLLVQARNLITGLALPAFLTDDEGRLLFFNDAAGVLLGRPFEEVGQLSRDEWAREIGPFDEEGTPLAADSLPLGKALRDGRPAQGRFTVRLAAGLSEVEVSSLPLQHPDAYEGALVAFWPVEAAQPETT
jgi:PAS domain-containing protein